MATPNAERLNNTQNVNIGITLRDLMEAGVYYGHRRRKWHPKMKPYIYDYRRGVFIIDIRKTFEQLQIAYLKAKEVSSKGGNIIFVCTKPQGKDVIKEEAKRAGVFYVTERWLGGLLTNFETIKKRLEYIDELENLLKEINEAMENKRPIPYRKKDVYRMERELKRMHRYYDGLRGLNDLPDLLYIVDIVREETAVLEARKLGIPVIGICDTNADPEMVDYPIPANDDSIRSIRLITKVIANAIIEGREGFESELTKGETNG